MKSVSVTHGDGTVDICQRTALATVVDASSLERLYWDEMRRVTLGIARFSDGAIRLFGRSPGIVRFGPVTDARRAIVGGLIVRRPAGTIAWHADGEHVSVTVAGFAPLLRGPLWSLESWFHELVGRRFLSRVEREAR